MEVSHFDLCETVSNIKDSTLVKTSSKLTPLRRNFFVAIYAAMRRLDDFVDEEFLTQDTETKNRVREFGRSCVSDWLAQMRGSEGSFLQDFIVSAARETVGRSNLDLDLFSQFATSMTDDVEERELQSWQDFVDYCTGATIAPTSIFIFMLACVLNADERVIYRYDLPRPPEYYATDMAIFCYIVHILRDIALDALQTTRLITIPTDFLSAASLTIADLRSCVNARKYERLLPLANLLLQKADFHLDRGRGRTAELIKFLDRDERASLERLYSVYELLKVKFESNYVEYLCHSVEAQRAVQGAVFSGEYA